MTKIILLAAAAVALASTSVRAQGVPGKDHEATSNAFKAESNAESRLAAAYRAGRCGSGLTFKRFAHKWAATGACSATWEGDWIENERRLIRDQRRSYEAYRMAQEFRAAGARTQGFGDQYWRSLPLRSWNANELLTGVNHRSR